MAGVIITYEGTPISNLTSTVTKTLKTGGKYCSDDIEVAYTAPDIEITSPLGDNAFKSCVGLTSISGSSPTSIGASCFQSCTNLTRVSGFDNVLTLGNSAFNGCTYLTEVSGFNSLTTMGTSCFYGCTRLQTVDGFNDLTSLNTQTFYNDTALTEVSGFASLTSIGQQAFQNCSALTTLPTEPVITSIGSQAFRACTSLVKFEMPTNVTALANQIFYGCTALTDLVIHGTVNNFQPGSANNAITNGCTNLERVTLPGGSLGSYVLYNNKKLAEVTVGGPGNAVSSINANAFYGCNGVICAFKVYTADGNPITHANGNFWGCNKSGSTCRFVDINDEDHYTDDQI